MKKLSCQFDESGRLAFPVPTDYVDARVLAANTAETLTKPTGAKFLRLRGNLLFYYNFNTTAAVPAADITNGTASVAVGASAFVEFSVENIASVSVVAPAATIVTAEWWS